MYHLLNSLRSDLDRSEGPDRPSLDETLESFDAARERLREADERLQHFNTLLKASRGQLDQERRRYFDVFNRAPEAILLTTLDGVVIEVNRAASALVGIPQHEARGRELAAFVPESERASLISEFPSIANSQSSTRRTISLCSLSGRLTRCEAAVGLVSSPDGATQLCWQLRDPSNSAVEVEVEEFDPYRALLDASPAVVWEADPIEHRIQFVSRAAEDLLGYPIDDWLSSPEFLLKNVYGDDRPLYESTRRRQRLDQNEVELEYRLTRADGRAVWVREYSRYIVDPRDGSSRFAGVLLNINKRKRVERRLYFCRSEAESKVRELNHLCELCQRLEISVHLPDVLSQILGAVVGMQGSEMGAIAMLDRERGELRMAASVGLCEEFLNKARVFPLGDSPCSTAVTENHTVVLEDVENSPDHACLLDLARTAGFRSIYSTPLHDTRGDAIGVLTTYFAEPHVPSERQREMVESYARRASQFIDHARRYSDPFSSGATFPSLLDLLGHDLHAPLAAINHALHQLDAMAESTPLAERRATLEVLARHARELSRMADSLIVDHADLPN